MRLCRCWEADELPWLGQTCAWPASGMTDPIIIMIVRPNEAGTAGMQLPQRAALHLPQSEPSHPAMSAGPSNLGRRQSPPTAPISHLPPPPWPGGPWQSPTHNHSRPRSRAVNILRIKFLCSPPLTDSPLPSGVIDTNFARFPFDDALAGDAPTSSRRLTAVIVR